MRFFKARNHPRTIGWLCVLGVSLLFFSAEHSLALPVPQDVLPQEVRLTPKQKILRDALDLLNKGDLNGAIEKTERVLGQEIENPAPAHEILGAALVLKGEIEAGLNHLQKAVEIDPKQSSAYTKIGDVYLAQGKIPAAREAFLKAVSINISDRHAHQRLGILYDREGRVQEAIAHYERGIYGTPPGYVGIKVDLGRLYNRLGRFQKTVNLLGGLVNETYQNPTGHLVLGTALLGLNETTEAVAAFKTAEALEPDTVRAPLSLGIAYRQQGAFERSLEALERAVALEPESSTGHYQLGETYVALEAFDKAEASFRKAEQYSKNPLFVQKRRVNLYLERKQIQEAINLCQAIIDRGEADAWVYERLGTAFQWTGRFERAEETFLTLRDRYSKTPFAHYQLGLFYGSVGKYDQSIDALEAALSRAPRDPMILKALSVAHNRKGSTDQAVRYARDLVALEQKTLNDRFYLASLLQENNEVTEAERLYLEILEENPNHVLALNNLADLMAEQGRLGEAVPRARRAFELAPENGMVLDTYGWILHRQGKQEEALEQLLMADEKMPNNPVILFHLGAVSRDLGDHERARDLLKKALQLSDRFKDAEVARNLLDALTADP